MIRMAKSVVQTLTHDLKYPHCSRETVYVSSCRECESTYTYGSFDDATLGPMSHYEGCVMDGIEAEEIDSMSKSERDAISRIKGEF